VTGERLQHLRKMIGQLGSFAELDGAEGQLAEQGELTGAIRGLIEWRRAELRRKAGRR
jgi:hypothetical protein